MKLNILILILLVSSCVFGQKTDVKQLPIIDMHLHASPADDNGPPPLALCLPIFPNVPPYDSKSGDFNLLPAKPPCKNPIWSPKTDEEVMNQTVEVLKRRNIIGVLSGDEQSVRTWHKAAPENFIPSLQFRIGRDDLPPEKMRKLFEEKFFVVLGEISNQYAGIAPDDKRMEPYWSLAEELDIPIAIHIGGGPPGAAVLFPTYRARLSNPYLLEEVLIRHPKLRVSVMHYASPLVDEMIAMLGAYPQIYIDLGGIQWFYSREYFYGQLKKFIDAGFGKRIMFGSDQMNFPGVIEPAIAIVEEAPFLNAEQKRDIFYNNAARFLRLSEKEIAKHHSESKIKSSKNKK